MAPMAEHHHRSTTKVLQKSFKSRHATKGHLKDLTKGKVEGERGVRNRKSLHQQVMSKIDRRHHARQKQQQKHKEHSRATSIFSGPNRAPRIVAVVPLTEDTDARAAIGNLNKCLDLEEVELPAEGICNVTIDRFKQSLQYIPVQRNMLAALDACRVADYVVFVLSSTKEVDGTGETLLRAIESQGVSNVLTVVQSLDSIEPPKKRPQVIASLKSFISHFFPHQEKIHSLDSAQECINIIRSLCTSTPKGVRWREDRSWVLVDNVEWPTDSNAVEGSCILTGIIRGKGLKANRLLQVGDWGSYQIEKITEAPSTTNYKKRKVEDMAVDAKEELQLLEQPDEDQDDLAELAPEDIIMDDREEMAMSEAPTERRGVLLDDHHYFSEDEAEQPEAPKRLPRGTSSYQAAWYLGDMSDSGSDWEDDLDEEGDVSMESPALPQDGLEGLDKATQKDPTEGAPSEYPQSEMFLDPSPDDEAEQIAAYRSKKKTEAEEDLEFPDEIELHPNVLARERLARYRGLKSLRTSKWATEEDKAHEPEDWNRLLQVPDYKAARSQATREALVGGVKSGTRVHIHLRNVPASLRSSSSSKILTAFSLLRHEHKRTVMNFSITLNSDASAPLKSKEDLVIQCGPRRLVINPLFSASGNTPNNVHKFDRYLHPGRSAIATFIGPVTWGAVPTLFFKPTPTAEDPNNLTLIATGTAGAPSSSRVIAKRIILTGHPFKIHKKLVTIRYMFFNAEDVQWFKALQLWTKRGRSGFIQQSLGTHGYFKATFDARINPQDSVGVSLYKRVWPRRSRAWKPETKDDKAPPLKEIEMSQ